MNIVLIVCDTLRADHVGCYGYFRQTTPHIDRLAREGVLFEEFFSAGCPTGPGFTSIFTGLFPIRHGYYRFGEPNTRQIDDKIFTMAEIFKAMGFTTIAFDNLISVLYARGKHFVRGYDYYVNCGTDAFDVAHFLTADQLNRRLLPLMERLDERPFFLYIHYWDPHMPYNQPDEYRSLFKHRAGDLSDLEVRRAPAGYDYIPGWGKVGAHSDGEHKAIYGPYPTMSIELYDGEIAYMDNAIGDFVNLLEKRSLLDETLIALTADHGEQLYQHEGYGWEHGGLHDADTHLPLLMRYPAGLPQGRTVKGFCQQVDILPTLFELCEQSPGILDSDGLSLLPLLQGKPIRESIFMEHLDGQRAVRTAEWKLLDNQRRSDPNPPHELFRVSDDPMEVIDLAGSRADTVRELKEKLFEWIGENLDGREDPIIYNDVEELREGVSAYRQKIRNFKESLQ